MCWGGLDRRVETRVLGWFGQELKLEQSGSGSDSFCATRIQKLSNPTAAIGPAMRENKGQEV